jgi:hypothetical protein
MRVDKKMEKRKNGKCERLSYVLYYGGRRHEGGASGQGESGKNKAATTGGYYGMLAKV